MVTRIARAVAVTAALGAAPAAAQSPPPPGGIPGLEAIDHVAIAVNDVEGAIGAYERLGFEVVRTGDSASGAVAAFVDLGDAFFELVAPRDSAGTPQPYTFEGALGQAWRVSDLDAAVSALEARGVEALRPDLSGPVVAGVAIPRPQPVSGTEIALVEVDVRARAQVLREMAGIEGGRNEDPRDHENGAVGFAYVTVAARHPDRPLEVLRQWGLDAAEVVDEARGAQSVRVDLPRGALFVVTPRGAGGIADFLEERRAHAPPIGERLYEGSILSVGVAVEDLDETVAFLEQRGIPHVAMDLPRFGRTEVVQGAPGWALRLEFVEAPVPVAAAASPSSSPAAESAQGVTCSTREECR